MLIFKKIIIGLLIFTFTFFAFFLYKQQNSKECLNLSEPESKSMISRILERERTTDKYARLLGIRMDSFHAGAVSMHPAQKDFLAYIEVNFLSNKTNEVVLKAVIFETCEIQWIKQNTKQREINKKRDTH